MHRGSAVEMCCIKEFIRAFTSCLLSAPRSRLVIAKSLSCRPLGSGNRHIPSPCDHFCRLWLKLNIVQFSTRFSVVLFVVFERKDKRSLDHPGPVWVAVAETKSEFYNRVRSVRTQFNNFRCSRNIFKRTWECPTSCPRVGTQVLIKRNKTYTNLTSPSSSSQLNHT